MNSSLVSARFQHGTPIPFWDDGIGPAWIMRDSIGIVGIVIAQTWEDAYSCCVDELMPDGEMPPEEFESDHDESCWMEANEWRGSGTPVNPRLKSCIAAKDLNGEALEPLTIDLLRVMKIKLKFSNQ